MNPKDLSFSQKIDLVRKSSMGIPKVINIDLAVPLADQVYHISGNVFYVFSSLLEADYVGIKVNETREPAVNYAVHCGLLTPFYRLFITTPAGQTGTMQIIYGTEAPELMEILDHRSTAVADLGAIVTNTGLIADELRGEITPKNQNLWILAATTTTQVLDVDNTRKGFWLDAKSTNTDSIFVGFYDDTIDSDYIKELLPSAGWGLDDYRGKVYAWCPIANQKLAMGAW